LLVQTLTADLHNLGYVHQTSVDFSSVVIQAMSSKYVLLDTQWLEMDVRDLGFGDASFDNAIDKGTLDAFLHGSLWTPPDDVRENVKRYVDEVLRVLKPGGKWLYITYRQPHFMKPMLARDGDWTLNVETLAEQPGGGGMFEYFAFIMTKNKEENKA
jgi:EEF1A lysine methyltransferase 4